MRGVISFLLGFGLALSLAPSSAFALNCGQRLVVVGDSSAHVLGVCGDPYTVQTRTATRTRYVQQEQGGVAFGSIVTESVQIDVWVYNFGPRRFMEELTFENGILVSMRALGYGHVPRRQRSTSEPDREARAIPYISYRPRTRLS